MKAIVIREHGGREALNYETDFEKPVAGDGEVLVNVKATGVNRIDLLVRGGYPGIEIPMPHIPGGDLTGVVSELGAGVSDLSPGDRVVSHPIVWCGNCALCNEGKENLCLNWKYLGLHLKGAYAEYAVVPARNLIKLPESVSFEDAAALPVAGLTAYHALVGVGNLEAGQTFMIWGGAGGLGTMAVSIAKHLGARVIATASTPEKLDLIKSLGADLVLDRTSDDIPAAVREFAPAGVDLALDYVGPETFQTTFDLLKKGGTMLLCGILTGRETNFSIHMTYLRHLNIRGLYLGEMGEMRELLNLVAEGKVRTHIGEVFDLSEAADAQDKMASGNAAGKIVLKV